ncbi:MAG TPA: hypothetical protein VMW33_02015, partial [Ilumatobacteraceae bacterium]|nr:hypothetical protein [Ilumatobacteraceae bacterium]
LPVGVRPPVFPDEPATSRILDTWVDDSTDDTERRCRTLRRTAILHAASLDGWDPDANVSHLS